MMTFYAAAGSYQLKEENNRKMPYIQRLGRLHPISVPEFVVWCSLLWEVMTYDEVKEEYYREMRAVGMDAPDFDEILKMLVKRKLLVQGVGYTGMDALYSMLSDTYVVPTRMTESRRFIQACKLYSQRKIGFWDVVSIMKREHLDCAEARVMDLVKQTPLSAAELIRCFDCNITDVSTPEKVINGIYPREDSSQDTLSNETAPSENVNAVLKAIADLYLGRKVILELA